jgi:streptogramin lyase
MSRKLFFVLTIFVLLCGALGGKATAQTPAPTTEPSNQPANYASSSESEPNQDPLTASLQPSGLTFGQPGLSFRYVKTFGETEVPYLADTTHLNSPAGLFIDSSNNLFVGESQGARVLKYSPTGANLLAIGHAGQNYHSDDNFSSLQDMILDSGGNIWVADNNRIVQYNATGVFQKQFPADQPWQSGSDNDRFNGARGIALDHANRMFVSDGNNHRVQVFDITSGSPVYSATIGVTGVSGSDALHLNQPYRIAVDSANKLYVADYGNNRVQKCEYSGGSWACSTVIGSLNKPQGLTVDSSDNLYIANTDAGRLIKCPSGGVCSVINSATYWLYDLAIDTDGNIYGSTSYHNLILKYNNSGVFISKYLGVEDVPYLTDSTHFNHPRVAIDPNDNIIILEENGQRLTKLNPQGVAQWSIGAPGHDVPASNAHFNWPHGVAVDKDGFIYVADNNRVQIFNGNGVYQATIGGASGNGEYQFQWATGIAVDRNNGNIYVSDCHNHRVQIYNSSRTYLATLGVSGVSGTDNSHFNCPIGIEVDANGSIFVADINNNRVQKFNSSRVYQMTFGTLGSRTNSFADVSAEDVTVDAQGRVYIGGWDNNRVEVFDSTGAYLTTIAGRYGNYSSQSRGISGVAVDSQGNVYVSDFTNARIQKFAPGVPGWKQVNINGFGDPNYSKAALNVFNGKLYAGVTNWNAPPQIWQSGDGKSWSNVSTPGVAINSATTAILDMVNFNGQMYAGTGWSTAPASIWRTTDGTTWTAVTTDSFGVSSTPRNVDAMVVYQGKIYAAVSSESSTTGIGVYIYRSATGDPGTWSAVVTGGNGDIQNTLVGALIEFNGALYACGKNPTQGAFIWKSSPDGSTWTQVGSYGLDASHQDEAITMAVFNGKLYLGTYSPSARPAQIWSSPDGSTWSPVVQDGFGDVNNHNLMSLYTFDNALYAVSDNDVTGNEIWKSTNGSQWVKIAPDGLGNSNNNWTIRDENAITSFNNSLYLAWANEASGVELWQMLSMAYIPLLQK